MMKYRIFTEDHLQEFEYNIRLISLIFDASQNNSVDNLVYNNVKHFCEKINGCFCYLH